MQKRYILILGLASSVAVMSCGKKKSTSAQEVSDAINNALAIGYPDGLSIPTFPKTTTASSLALSEDDALGIDANDTKGQTLAQKRDDAKKILEGGVEDCFENMKKRAQIQFTAGETCYEFDQDMIYGYRNNGSAKGTKTGKSAKPGSEEVCMVSFAREEMKDIEAIIDQQLDRAQAMACIAKKSGKTLPANANDEIDITADMQAKRPSDPNAPSFSSVKLKRLADSEGKPVFETKVVSTRGSASEELTIVHRPNSSTDNNSYNGVISIKRSGETRDNGKNMLLSIEYARSEEGGEKKIRASVRRARLAAAYTETFDASGLVNFATVPETFSQPANDNIEGISLVEFEMNQADSTGNLSYWKNPGGGYTEAARGFVFKVDKDSTATVKGCSVSGAANDISIRKAIKDGTSLMPTGWYHPFFESGAALSGDEYDFQKPGAKWKKPSIDSQLATDFVTNQKGTALSRQCFKQDSNGNYVIDVVQIPSTAGYELIQTSDTAKFINPPDLTAIKGKSFRN